MPAAFHHVAQALGVGGSHSRQTKALRFDAHKIRYREKIQQRRQGRGGDNSEVGNLGVTGEDKRTRAHYWRH